MHAVVYRIFCSYMHVHKLTFDGSFICYVQIAAGQTPGRLFLPGITDIHTGSQQ